MNQSPLFLATYNPPPTWQVANDKWDQVMSLYEQGEYAESVRTILDFASPNARQAYGNADQTHFEIPHGSIYVQILLEENTFAVHAPFVGLEGAQQIPLLRQVSELNFAPLNLARIQLQDNALLFSYQCPLELCEPYMVYRLLQEICMYADAYDDEFVQKFQAKRLKPPHIQPYSAEASEEVVKGVREYIAQAETYYAYFEQKREFGLCWYLLAYTLMAIEQYAAPQGQTRMALGRAISALHRDTPYPERLQAGRRAMRKLAAKSDEAWKEDLYEIGTLIPYKESSSPANVRKQLEESYQLAHSRRDNGDHMGACMAIMYVFVKLSYDYFLPKGTAEQLFDAMRKGSQLTWVETSEILWQTLDSLMKNGGTIPENAPVKSGWEILRGFFGRRG